MLQVVEKDMTETEPAVKRQRPNETKEKVEGLLTYPSWSETRTQGSYSSWKTWKNYKSFSSPGKVLEFYNFIKNPGKMNCLGKK